MDASSTIRLRTGNEIPVMGLGTWKLTDDTAATIATALELGYAMIDTSGDYGTQPGIGEGIKRSGVDRDSFYLVTKVEDDDAYEKTKLDLQELQLDRADLMLIHRPPEDGVGVDLWRGLIRARDDGLTRDIGVSNYSMDQIDELIDATGEIPAVNQIEWSPYGHSADALEHARQHGIVIQAYSPLTRSERLESEVLDDIAQRHGKSPAQIMLRWNLQRGTVPLPKASSAEHLKENLDIFDFELTEDELAEITGLNEHYSALGKLPYV